MSPLFPSLQQSGQFDPAMTPVLNRLEKWVSKHYQAEMRFHLMHQLAPSFAHLLKNNSYISLENSVLVRISTDDGLLGAVELHPTQHLLPQNVRKVHEVVQIIIEAALENGDSLYSLKFLETQLQTSYSEPKSNLIRMDRFRRAQSLPTKQLPSPIKSAFNIPCLIHCANQLDILRMSIEVHSLSKRYAFVQFSEIDSCARLSASALHQMGPLTIFIPNICQLTQGEQQALIEFFNSYRSHQSPQVIAGTLIPQLELKRSQLVNEELLQRIAVAYLRMDRSFEDYKKMGIPTFLYDSLTGYPQSTPQSSGLLNDHFSDPL